jgi:hypothetical protein
MNVLAAAGALAAITGHRRQLYEKGPVWNSDSGWPTCVCVRSKQRH